VPAVMQGMQGVQLVAQVVELPPIVYTHESSKNSPQKQQRAILF